jgi:hypothetical protein
MAEAQARMANSIAHFNFILTEKVSLVEVFDNKINCYIMKNWLTLCL